MNVLRWSRRSRRGLAVVLASLLSTSALLAPRPAAADAGEYAESGDAGSTLADAAVPGGTGALTKISGSLADNLDEDLYKICVSGTFKAVIPDPQPFDSTLYVFDETGAGVVSNDDAVPSGSEISGFAIAPGTYYLAVAAYDNDPIDANGAEIWPDEPFGGSKPPNDGVGVLDHWGGSGGATGAYFVNLEGVGNCGAEYTESGDAGSTLDDAAIPGGTGALTKISGSLAENLDEDLYKICVSGTFKAVIPDPQPFDSTLYIFDETGAGVVSNDDAVPSGSEISGFAIEPGTYYLAVAAYDNDPIDANGAEIWPDEPFGGSKPPNAGVGVLDHWGGSGGATGDYFVNLEGVDNCGSGPPPIVTSSTPSTGTRAGGTSVTITGSGFTDATEVRVGSVAAPAFTVDSDTQITATTPARPECPSATFNVRVVGPAGAVSLPATGATFTYDTTGCPKVTGLDPALGVPGTSVKITGTDLTGATAVTFGTTAATSFTVDSATQITAVAPDLAAGVYDVVVAKGLELSEPSETSKYEAGHVPAVTSLTRTTGSPLGGTSLQVFGTNFTDDAQVLFGDTPGGDVTVYSSIQIQVTAPALPSHTVVHVRVVNRFGTSPAGPDDVFTFIYDPVPTFISPDSGPSTGGTSVRITGEELLGVTAVLFGSQRVPCPQQCTVVSREEVDVQTLPHAISGVTVRLEAPDGPSVGGVTFAFTGIGGFKSTGTCLPDCANSGVVLLPNGKVLGVSGTFGDNGIVTQANIYDPATDAWKKGAVCQGCGLSFRGTSSLTLLKGTPAQCGTNCGKLLAMGLGSAALYDPAADSWSPLGPMATDQFSYFTSTLLANGKVLNVRAGAFADVPEAQVFDPLTGTFALIATPLHFHSSHAATLLKDGRVLVTGGGGQGGKRPFSVFAELYDPATNTWTDTGEMGQARFAHTSTLLNDGRVLVTGGQLGFSAPMVSSEIWNPATGTWSPTANMIFPRSDHDVTLLPDGRLLAIGGDELGTDFITHYDIGHSPTLGEVYDPATQDWLPTSPSNLNLGDNNTFGQSNVARSVLLPSGPLSVCGVRCGQVLVIRGSDQDSKGLVPSSVVFAPPPRATLAPTAGTTAGGTTLTLTGTGLASVSAVSFGGVPATSVTPDPTTPDTKVSVVTPARIAGAVDVAVTTAGGSVIAGKFTYQTPAVPPAPPAPEPAAPAPLNVLNTIVAPSPSGYALAAADGGVFNFGTLPFAGSLGGAKPTGPIVAIEHTPSGKGYWLAGSDGSVYGFGDAAFKGSTGGIRLAKPIVDIVGTPTGNGYWLVAADGGVFAFGDAVFRGSTGALRLNSPIVAAERSASGGGYWLVGADGGVFAFGNAAFKGSTGAIRLAQPVVSAARSPGGAGYWLIAADGGVFAFGDALFHGSTGALKLNSPIVGSAPATAGSGYVLCARDGGAFAFGAAGFAGSMGGARLNSPVSSCSAPRPAAAT